jgi:hypothetical protein
LLSSILGPRYMDEIAIPGLDEISLMTNLTFP